MKKLIALFALAASPAFASSGPFFSLFNTNFVVLISFLVFLAALVYFKVPGMLGKMLDDRASGIRNELDEAKALREEAQTLLAKYERRQHEMAEQSKRIVEHARVEATEAAEAAKAELQNAIARRIAAAEDQISAAEAGALREVRDRAIQIAVAAAGDVIAAKTDAKAANALIDDAIADLGSKLH